MNIGLDELSDDQLMELLNEVCIELAVRDPIVKKLAQGCIRDVGTILPEIRRTVQQIVQNVNEEELDGRTAQPRGGSRKNPSRKHPHYASSPGATMPGGFTVPQNPPPPNPYNSVSFIAPVGYRDIKITLEHLLKTQINRPIALQMTGSPHIFHAALDDSEVIKVRTSPMFSQFQIIVT